MFRHRLTIDRVLRALLPGVAMMIVAWVACAQQTDESIKQIERAAIIHHAAALAAERVDVCTAIGWYQPTGDKEWMFAVPGNKTGDITQGGTGAHTLSIFGADGAFYQILDQCHETRPCTAPLQGTYKRPTDLIAGEFWDRYYVKGEVEHGVTKTAEQIRHRFGHYNANFKVPLGALTYTFITLSQMPEPSHSIVSETHSCGRVTPAPTTSPNARMVTPGRMPTPMRTQARTGS